MALASRWSLRIVELALAPARARPSWEPKARSLDRPATWNQIRARLDGVGGTIARQARDLVKCCAKLTAEIRKLDQEIAASVAELAPSLLAII
ncbi:hypothetical protein WCD74_22095 [Actinomycetospora sp. OC33-EN08]|uniref:Transposase n=1 Tax=Actinomycetospora aurantiaca TaxID=3129233 RepID=A0ABU8MTI1_9PSEU